MSPHSNAYPIPLGWGVAARLRASSAGVSFRYRLQKVDVLFIPARPAAVDTHGGTGRKDSEGHRRSGDGILGQLREGPGEVDGVEWWGAAQAEVCAIEAGCAARST